MFFISATPALADFSSIELEPYIGYEIGAINQSNIKKASIYGLNYGMRTVYAFQSFSPLDVKIGLDLMAGLEKGKLNDYVEDYRPFDLGPHLVLGVKSLGKIYFSYFLFSNARIQPDQNRYKFSGSGYKLGLSVLSFRFFKINLEMIGRNYTGYNNSDLAKQLEARTYGVNLSFPITFNDSMNIDDGGSGGNPYSPDRR